MKRMNLPQACVKHLVTMMQHLAFSLAIPFIGKDFRGPQVEVSQGGDHPGHSGLVIHRQHCRQTGVVVVMMKEWRDFTSEMEDHLIAEVLLTGLEEEIQEEESGDSGVDHKISDT